MLKYGYLDDNTALRRYTQQVVAYADHDSRISKKKKVVLATEFYAPQNVH